MNELINYIIVNYMKYSYLVSLINIFKKKAKLYIKSKLFNRLLFDHLEIFGNILQLRNCLCLSVLFARLNKRSFKHYYCLFISFLFNFSNLFISFCDFNIICCI